VLRSLPISVFLTWSIFGEEHSMKLLVMYPPDQRLVLWDVSVCVCDFVVADIHLPPRVCGHYQRQCAMLLPNSKCVLSCSMLCVCVDVITPIMPSSRTSVRSMKCSTVLVP
jgi:hypothetical protein